MVIVQNQNSRKYDLNFDFFKKWSYEMSYLLGYLFAEGNLDRSNARGHRFALQLESTDKKEVSLLAKNLNSKLKTRKRQNKKQTYYTYACSKEIAGDLMKLGIVPHKNSIMKFPKIPQKYLKMFIKGYFKGDGCVFLSSHKYKDKIYRYPLLKSTSNSFDFLKELNESVSSHLKILKGRVYRHSNGKAWILAFSIVPTDKILKWLG